MKSFSDQTYRLGSNIRQREGAGGGGVATTPIDFLFTYFSNHKDDIQS